MTDALDIVARYTTPERDKVQRANACVALGLMKDDASLGLLKKLAKDVEPSVRTEAAIALRQRVALRKVKSWRDRLESVGTLRSIAASELNARNRLTLFWPAYLVALLLPVFIWLAIGYLLAPWPAMNLGQFDLEVWLLSAGLAFVAVIAASLSTSSLPPQISLADLAAEARDLLAPAIVIGLGALACAYFATEGEMDPSGLLIVLCMATLFVPVIRLETAMIRMLLPPTPLSFIAGLVLAFASGLGYMAIMGVATGPSTAGDTGATAAGASGFVVMGLPAVIALAFTYLQADHLSGEIVPQNAPLETVGGQTFPRMPASALLGRALLAAGLVALCVPGVVLLWRLFEGRSLTMAETGPSTGPWPDGKTLLLPAGQVVPFDLDSPGIVRFASERGRLSLATVTAGAAPFFDYNSYAPGGRVWVARGQHAWTVVPDSDTAVPPDADFQGTMDVLSFLALRSSETAPTLPPVAMRLERVTFSIMQVDDPGTIGRVELASEKSNLEGDAFAVVLPDAITAYGPGSLLYGSEGAWLPAYAWRGSDSSARPTVTGNDPTLGLMGTDNLPQYLASSEAYHDIYSPFTAGPTPTAWSLAAALPDGAGNGLISKLAQLETVLSSTTGGLVVYTGGSPFANVGIGTVLRPLAGRLGDKVALEVINGNTTERVNMADGITYVMLPRDTLRVLPQTPEAESLLLEIRKLPGLPTAHLTAEMSGSIEPETAVSNPLNNPPQQWVDVSKIPREAPPEFFGYFLVVGNNGVYPFGTVVKGDPNGWDQSTNPGFTRVVDGEASGSYQWVDIVDLLYLGDTYQPEWPSMFDFVALPPLPNSPDDLRSRPLLTAAEIAAKPAGSYFMDVIASGFASGSIARKRAASNSTLDLVYGWGSPEFAQPNSMVFLGDTYDPAWEAAALALRQEGSDLLTYIDAAPADWQP